MDLLASFQRHYWVDNLDPWAIHFSGILGVRWYGLAYLAGFLMVSWTFNRWARTGRLPIPVAEVPAFVLYAALGVVIGGRLGYCLLYEWPYVFPHPLEIFEMWHGGMASHGGITGLIIAIWIYARERGIGVLSLLDAATGPLGIGFGRIANFINGELWGRPTTVPGQ